MNPYTAYREDFMSRQEFIAQINAIRDGFAANNATLPGEDSEEVVDLKAIIGLRDKVIEELQAREAFYLRVVDECQRRLAELKVGK